MIKYYLTFLLGALLIACEQAVPQAEKTAAVEENPAQQIIDQCIEKHGGEAYSKMELSFGFRDRTYKGSRIDGQFSYERLLVQEDGTELLDILDNDRLIRKQNGTQIELTAKDSSAYANSVNSVFYFALLPHFLNDPAAIKTYLGTSTIREQPYHKIKVTFQQEGGGKDFEDQFIYWIHQDNYTMDYLAYNYLTDGGGARFREAYNVRTIEGIRFADYINYKPEPDTKEVATFDALFEQGLMKELSRIDTENIEVKLLP
ncbi:MAG: hypothetical protein KTR30_32415 [Saprospiraceae bacterium]|nr:hypothetical protein [Saprospiraceae bacterium]